MNKEFIKNKIGFIQQELEMLKKYKGCRLEEIAKDYFILLSNLA